MSAQAQRIVVGDDGEIFADGQIMPPPEAHLYGDEWRAEERKGEATIRAIVLGSAFCLWLYAAIVGGYHILASSPPVRAPVASTVAAPAADLSPLTGAIEAAPVSNPEAR